MPTQLCVTFGLLVVVMFCAFMALWAAAVFSLRDSIKTHSRENLREQVAIIGRRISEEARQVFESKIAVGASSFLTPIYVVLFDSFASPGYSLQPLPTYRADHMDNLHQPLSADGRFRCNTALCVPDSREHFGFSSGGCNCSTGEKM